MKIQCGGFKSKVAALLFLFVTSTNNTPNALAWPDDVVQDIRHTVHLPLEVATAMKAESFVETPSKTHGNMQSWLCSFMIYKLMV